MPSGWPEGRSAEPDGNWMRFRPAWRHDGSCLSDELLFTPYASDASASALAAATSTEIGNICRGTVTMLSLDHGPVLGTQAQLATGPPRPMATCRRKLFGPSRRLRRRVRPPRNPGFLQRRPPAREPDPTARPPRQSEGLPCQQAGWLRCPPQPPDRPDRRAGRPRRPGSADLCRLQPGRGARSSSVACTPARPRSTTGYPRTNRRRRALSGWHASGCRTSSTRQQRPAAR